jgi:hypothetical protein
MDPEMAPFSPNGCGVSVAADRRCGWQNMPVSPSSRYPIILDPKRHCCPQRATPLLAAILMLQLIEEQRES